MRPINEIVEELESINKRRAELYLEREQLIKAIHATGKFSIGQIAKRFNMQRPNVSVILSK
jgi:hypothetical protein